MTQPGVSVRLKLALSYGGFLFVAGILLLAVVWLFLLRYVPSEVRVPAAFRPGGFIPGRRPAARLRPESRRGTFLPARIRSGGRLVSRRADARAAAPHRRCGALAAKGSLSHRINLEGRGTSSANSRMCSTQCSNGSRRTSRSSSASPRTPPTNCGHPWPSRRRCWRWRAPTLTGTSMQLLDRLRVVNTRAIDLTEALLLLSRADRRLLHREPVDPVARRRAGGGVSRCARRGAGVTIEVAGDPAGTPCGSPAVLLPGDHGGR